MRIAYIPEKRLSKTKLALIEIADQIIQAYAAKGFDLTLRQLYYQFVSQDLIPNNEKMYKRLGDAISDGRMLGMLPWDSIVDRTRSVKELSHWDTPLDVLDAARRSYRIDLWENQPNRVEVWIEKDALIGVIAKACQDLDVPYFACRGYGSLTAMWEAGQRIVQRYHENGQETVIIHLGDHDPSGIDMTRDIVDRLYTFTDRHDCPFAYQIERVALNEPQIEEFKPPPNPAKLSDSRAESYIARFGRQSWELDALDPTYISDLVTDTISKYLDDACWAEAMQRYDRDKTILASAIDAAQESMDEA